MSFLVYYLICQPYSRTIQAYVLCMKSDPHAKGQILACPSSVPQPTFPHVMIANC